MMKLKNSAASLPATLWSFPNMGQKRQDLCLGREHQAIMFPSKFCWCSGRCQERWKSFIKHISFSGQEKHEIVSVSTGPLSGVSTGQVMWTTERSYSISYTESFRDLQQSYQDVQQSYRTRDFELECSISAPVRSSVHRNRTYPTPKTFLRFLNYRSFEGVEALEGCETLA